MLDCLIACLAAVEEKPLGPLPSRSSFFFFFLCRSFRRSNRQGGLGLLPSPFSLRCILVGLLHLTKFPTCMGGSHAVE